MAAGNETLPAATGSVEVPALATRPTRQRSSLASPVALRPQIALGLPLQSSDAIKLSYQLSTSDNESQWVFPHTYAKSYPPERVSTLMSSGRYGKRQIALA